MTHRKVTTIAFDIGTRNLPPRTAECQISAYSICGSVIKRPVPCPLSPAITYITLHDTCVLIISFHLADTAPICRPATVS